MSDSTPSSDGWLDLADDLQAHGVPERRAEVVALVENGLTHAQVTDELGLGSRSEVSRHLKYYREDLANARWLTEYAPDV